MSDVAAFVLTVLCTAVLFGIWHGLIERVPLQALGLEQVRQVLDKEPAERRERILARGWTTRDEWWTIVMRQRWSKDSPAPTSPDRDEA